MSFRLPHQLLLDPQSSYALPLPGGRSSEFPLRVGDRRIFGKIEGKRERRAAQPAPRCRHLVAVSGCRCLPADCRSSHGLEPPGACISFVIFLTQRLTVTRCL